MIVCVLMDTNLMKIRTCALVRPYYHIITIHSSLSLSLTHTHSLSRSLYIDIDECAINGNSLCQQHCTNTEGSYQCSCGEWYVFESPYNCTGQFYLLFLARKINNFEHLLSTKS